MHMDELIICVQVILVPVEYVHNDRAPDSKLHGLHIKRFFDIKQWIDQSTDIDKYTNLILTDFRDTMFQSNPFAQITSEGVYQFEEQYLLKDNAWNIKWLSSCLGRNLTDKLISHNFTVVCVGVVMGRLPFMLEYLHHLVNAMMRIQPTSAEVANDCRHGLDTAAHYEVTLHHLPLVNTIPYGEGQTSHFLKEPIMVDSLGRVLNHHGVPYAILHQADRHPQVWDKFLAAYPYLSSSPRRAMRV